MGNFVTTGSRASEKGEGANLGGCDEKLMDIVNDSGPVVEDYIMSEGASQQEENVFHDGDFVWVQQVNSHHWWPGKIYDSSDASDLALKSKHDGKLLLVAYFGSEEFDWCNPSQLKPFFENFKEFASVSDSRGLKEAVGEIGECVERFLVCEDESLVSPNLVVNSGIKKGVVVSDVGREIVLSLVLEKPGIVLEDVKSLAKSVGFSDLLEVEVLKRKLSAFYRCKGRFGLAKYDEYGYIIGLEDNEEDSLSFVKSSLKRCSGFASYKRKCSDNRKNQERVLSPRKRKNKRGLDDGIESNDSNHLEESEDSSMEIVVDLLSTPLVSLTKRVKVDVSQSVETILQRGERKKSKYYSPEYFTDFSPRVRKSKGILPSKDDMIKTYKEFASDSLENHNEKNETETRNSVREIECLKEKLEEIKSLLDQTEGVITEELKIKLEDEFRNLLDKVSKIIVPLSSII